MNAADFVNQITQSPVVLNEIPMGLDMGLPQLRVVNGGVCFQFYMHNEELENGQIVMGPVKYEVGFFYPSGRLASFECLSQTHVGEKASAVCAVNADIYATYGMQMIDELYETCTWALDICERSGGISELAIRKYNEKLREMIHTFKLEPLYG